MSNFIKDYAVKNVEKVNEVIQAALSKNVESLNDNDLTYFEIRTARSVYEFNYKEREAFVFKLRNGKKQIRVDFETMEQGLNNLDTPFNCTWSSGNKFVEYTPTFNKKAIDLSFIEQEEKIKRAEEAEKQNQQSEENRKQKVAVWTEKGKELMTQAIINIITNVINTNWNEIITVYPSTVKETLIENTINNFYQKLGNEAYVKSNLHYFNETDREFTIQTNPSMFLDKEILNAIFKVSKTDESRTVTAKVKAFYENREYKGGKAGKKVEVKTFYYYNSIEKGFLPVEGNAVTIEGIKCFIHKINGSYSVVELKSGLTLGLNSDTKQEAIEKSTELVKKNKDRMDSLIESAIKRVGSSPNTLENFEEETEQEEKEDVTIEENFMNDKKITNVEFLELINKYKIELSYSLNEFCKNKLDAIGLGQYSYRAMTKGSFPKELSNIVDELYEVIKNNEKKEIEAVKEDHVTVEEQEVVSNASESIVSDNKKMEYKDIKIEFKTQNEESDSSTFQHEQQGKEIEFSSG